MKRGKLRCHSAAAAAAAAVVAGVAVAAAGVGRCRDCGWKRG